MVNATSALHIEYVAHGISTYHLCLWGIRQLGGFCEYGRCLCCTYVYVKVAMNP